MAAFNQFFSRMTGTLAVILVVAAVIGGTDILSKFFYTDRKLKYSLIIGIFGGFFGVYGNMSGVDFNGAVISVRDVGPMLAGFAGGPIGGLLAGLIAGLHRLTLGGITATACITATCIIGIICGTVSILLHRLIEKPWFAFIIGVLMETLHLGIVLIMVKPFETALGIVKSIFVPFILVNAIGFSLLIALIGYIERQRNLTLERNRMHSELEIATVIQHSLLPTIDETYPARKEIDVYAGMDTAKEVGGDFYDLFFIDKNKVAFIIADVSGKGVPAALFMATSKTILQSCVRDIPDLGQALATANNALCKNNMANMFVTAWVGILDLTDGNLTFASAGHNPPVLLSEGKAEYLKIKNGFVLAGMEGVKYKTQSITLKSGDKLFLYTDGVTEAENTSHELFGEDRLISCIAETQGMTSGDTSQKVKDAVNGFAGKAEQFDDITMLCVRLTESDNNDTGEAV